MSKTVSAAAPLPTWQERRSRALMWLALSLLGAFAMGGRAIKGLFTGEIASVSQASQPLWFTLLVVFALFIAAGCLFVAYRAHRFRRVTAERMASRVSRAD